ncbi:hypothetical protein AQUCO_00300836v1 [Aquilegia coerulea]|uniref:NAC domain-containing protein n=1 Tax=Aquilegia coerulea TaxID=218851 RepID=A0A2G5F0U2_AQUCA|nr:hypothetical protein AQUCO_00300836v1 [Aquilegia coerulea]
MPLGYRFRPRDIQICEFVAKKNIDPNYSSYPLCDGCNVYGAEPWVLPVVGAEANMGKGFGEHQYYFDMSKYRSRKAGRGRWLANTKDIPILLDGEKDKVIGFKRALTYFIYPEGRRSSKDDIKTNWIMHEYRQYKCLENNKTQWTLCKIGETGTTSPRAKDVRYEEQHHHQQQQQQYNLLGSIAASANEHTEMEVEVQVPPLLQHCHDHEIMDSEDQRQPAAFLVSFEESQQTSPQDWDAPTMDELFNELAQQTGMDSEDQGQPAGFPYFDEY